MLGPLGFSHSHTHFHVSTGSLAERRIIACVNVFKGVAAVVEAEVGGLL